MPRDDPALFIGEDRDRPTPFPYAGGDLRDLGVRMLPGVARVWDQPLDRPAFDIVGWPQPVRHPRSVLFISEKNSVVDCGEGVSIRFRHPWLRFFKQSELNGPSRE